MSTLVQAETRIRELLSYTGTDEDILDTVIQSMLANVLEVFSKDSPRILRSERVGNSEYQLEIPSLFNIDFSTLERIVHPVGGQQNEIEIDNNEYRVVRVDTTTRGTATITSGASELTLSTVTDAAFYKVNDLIRIADNDANEVNWCSADGNVSSGVVTLKNTAANLYDATPLVSKSNHVLINNVSPLSPDLTRMEFTGLHVLTSTTGDDTIPVNDLIHFYHLGTSMVALAYSAFFAKKAITGVDADSIDFQQKADSWKIIADQWMTIYKESLGITGESKVKAGASILDIDSRYQWGSRFLTHNSRFR